MRGDHGAYKLSLHQRGRAVGKVFQAGKERQRDVQLSYLRSAGNSASRTLLFQHQGAEPLSAEATDTGSMECLRMR